MSEFEIIAPVDGRVHAMFSKDVGAMHEAQQAPVHNNRGATDHG
jgi:hypothetical protein